MAVGRGFERLWPPVRCSIHRPSSVEFGRSRPELSRRQGGQSGASCVQRCDRPDPPSSKHSCAGVKMSGLKKVCCILGISHAACWRAAAAESPSPSPSPTRRRIRRLTRRQIQDDSEARRTAGRGLPSGFRTGSWPSPPGQVCLQACVALVAGVQVRNLYRWFYLDRPFNRPLRRYRCYRGLKRRSQW